jgi:RNA polymerase sigma-70 factor (ECF subfamily)
MELKTEKLPISDEEIIELYWSRDEKAITETDLKYKNYLFTVAYNIVHAEADSQECLSDTYLAVWNAIPPKEPDPLASYVYRTGRNMALKRLEYLSAEKRNNSYDLSLDELAQYLPDEDAEHILNAQEIADIINNFLAQDTDINRYIFIRRYWYGDSVEDIAKSVNMKSGAVSVRLNRIRTKLKEQLIKEGYYYEA